MSEEEKYKKFKKALETARHFLKTKKMSLTFVCNCGQEITVNGATSHSLICKDAYLSKTFFLIENFKLDKVCSVCNKSIIYEKIIDFRGHVNFCSSECRNVARKYVFKFEKNYRQCVVCSKYKIMTSKTCSDKCYKDLISQNLRKNWEQLQGVARSTRIQLATKKFNEIRKTFSSWNAGLHGEEFLKHYEKSDGTNKLFETLKKNFFYKKTDAEKRFESLIQEQNLNYQYSFFCCNRQFDFLVSLKKHIVIIEVDGDFWHKSKRRCKDELIRESYRKLDLEKELVINKIKNTDKKWILIRFWEIDITDSLNKIKQLFETLVRNDEDEHKFKSVVQEIKEYYAQSC